MTIKKKFYITLIIWLLFASFFIFVIFFYLFGGVKDDAADLIAAKGEIASLNAEIENLSLVKEKYQEYLSNLNKINSLLVNSEVPIDFIRFLEKLALDSGVSMSISLSDGQKSEVEQWKYMYFRISSESAFLNFSRFLERLENSSYLIEVRDMNIRKINYKGENGVNADFTIRVYAK